MTSQGSPTSGGSRNLERRFPLTHYLAALLVTPQDNPGSHSTNAIMIFAESAKASAAG